jgi:hypothetical protein
MAVTSLYLLGYVAPVQAYSLETNRWRRDTVGESSASWLTAETGTMTGARKNEAARVRFSVTNPSSGPSGLYNVDPVTYNYQTLDSGATVITSSLSDDNYGGPYSLPFNVTLYGVAYSNFYVGSNGYVSFSPGTVLSGVLPMTAEPNAAVYAVLRDWHPGYGGTTVRYQTFGTAPNRTLVVEWNNISFYGSSGSTRGTFQIKMFEANQNFEVHVASAPSSTYTQGVENATGTAADWYGSRNYTNYSLTNDAVRFTPAVGGGSYLNARLEYAPKTSTCAAVSSWTRVPDAATTEHWQMAGSSYLTDAQATTHNSGLSVPSGKSFVTGQAKTTSAQAGPIGVTSGDYTEYEFSVEPTSDATDGGTYCFRLSNAGVAFASHSYYAEARVAAVPTAVADSYAVPHGDALNVPAAGVLANDSDVNGDALSATLATGVTHGSLTLHADGSFSYEPVAGYVGGDSFTYRAGNGQTVSAAAEVTISVTNDAPAVADDLYSLMKGERLRVASGIGVLANDTDAEGDSFTAVLLSNVEHGTLTLGANGTIDYLPASDWVGSDIFTYRAYDGFSYSEPATVTVVTHSQDSTIQNEIVVTRLEAGASNVGFSLTFTLQNTLSTPLTVTFPEGFTVTGAFTGGSCSSGSIGPFGFTTHTLTAGKSNCSGTVSLYGATLINPDTSGQYIITWTNDDPGFGSIYVTNADYINVAATVDPFMTFDVGASSGCDGAFVSSDWDISLSRMNTGRLTAGSGDGEGTQLICTRLSTNGTSGAVVTVRNANGAAGLVSASRPADSIASASAGITAGTPNYGLCYSTVSGDSGHETGLTPAGVAPSGSLGAFTVPSCTASVVSGAEAVGGLSSSPSEVWRVSTVTSNAFAAVRVKAAISATQPAHNDYSDSLTFVATSIF